MRMKMKSSTPGTKIERAEVPDRKGIEEETKKREDTGIRRAAEQPQEETKTQNPVVNQNEASQKRENQIQQNNDQPAEIEDEERYSDIDNEFERKLKDNGVEYNGDEDEQEITQKGTH